MTEIENMLTESATRIFAKEITLAHIKSAEQGEWQGELWSCLERTGLTRIFAPEDSGGAAASWSQALPMLLAASKHLAPVPFIETTMVGWILTRLGLDMPAGPMSLALADDSATVQAHGTGWRFSGRVSAPWGRFLRYVLVPVADADGKLPLWILLPTMHAKIGQDANIAGEPRDTLTFDAVDSHSAAPGHPAANAAGIDTAKLLGALQQAIQIAGLLERTLNQTVQYANDRVQFGKPIGSFQAIQQQLALFATQVVAARMAVAAACSSLPDADWWQQAAIAKTLCGQAASQATNVAHQVHGAIGFTYEHSLHFASRRLWSWRAEYGSDAYWAAQLGKAAIKRGGHKLWQDLTARDSATAAASV